MDWSALSILTGWAVMHYKPVRHHFQGEPTVLIPNGKVLEENMRRLRYNLDLLNSQLRVSDVFAIEKVEFATLRVSEAWLYERLADRGIYDFAAVFYAALDTRGESSSTFTRTPSIARSTWKSATLPPRRPHPLVDEETGPA